MNPHAERFVRTIKDGCLDRMILFGEQSLRNAIRHFNAHYHLERNHQGLDNRLITPDKTIDDTTRTVRRRQRLGGVLNYYYRDAREEPTSARFGFWILRGPLGWVAEGRRPEEREGASLSHLKL